MVGSSPWTDGPERAPVTITRHGDDQKLVIFFSSKKKGKVRALDSNPTSCTKIPAGRGSAFLGLGIRRPQSRVHWSSGVKLFLKGLFRYFGVIFLEENLAI